MPINVKNKAKALTTINTPQDFAHGGDARLVPTERTLTLSERQKSGEILPRIVERTVPASLTWLPGETKHGLPDALQRIPEFQSAVSAGRLIVTNA